MAAWGKFCPAAGAADCNSHLQAPPIVAEAVYDVDFPPSEVHLICKELDVELRALQTGSSFDVLDIVSRHCAPLAVLRRTVGLWQDDLPQDHCLKEPAEDVRLTLFPEYVGDTVQPTKQ